LVDIGLFPAPGGQLEVRVRPNGSGYDGVVTALTFTIRWESASGTRLGPVSQVIDGSDCPLRTLPIQPSPDGELDASGFRYLNFNGFGFTPLSSCPGYRWPADSWSPLMRVAVLPGADCASFNIVNDAYTAANNQDYYLSLFGAESSGAVPGPPVPVDGGAGPCTDCTGIPGGEALPGTACDDRQDCTLQDRYNTDCTCTGIALQAGFTLPTEPILAGTPVRFQSTSTPGALLNWDFGDGSTSTDTAPERAWTSPGTYPVSLIARNGSCAATATDNVTVGLPTGAPSPGQREGGADAWMADGHIWLRADVGSGPGAELLVHDLAGRRLLRQTLLPGPLHTIPSPSARGILSLLLVLPDRVVALRVLNL